MDVVLVVASADLLVEDGAVAAVEGVLLPPRMAEVVHLTQNTSYTVIQKSKFDTRLGCHFNNNSFIQKKNCKMF